VVGLRSDEGNLLEPSVLDSLQAGECRTQVARALHEPSPVSDLKVVLKQSIAYVDAA
jgi:outer membrane protein assembly factor BamE (lipoprotein component of BamABCDE complex)